MCMTWHLWHVKENRYSDREETDALKMKLVTFLYLLLFAF